MERPPKRPKAKILNFFLRLILACLFLSSLFYFLGPSYIRLFLPLFSWEIEKIHPEYDIKELYLNDRNQIWYQVRILRPTVDDGGRISRGQDLRGGVLGRTMYITPIIIISLLLAWPGLSIKHRLRAFIISVPLLIGAQLIDIPIHLINRIEAYWLSGSISGEVRRFWVYLLSNGGRQFLAFIVVLISIASVRLIKPSIIRPAGIGRNDPCPCGSGMKFKKCCGKQVAR